MQHRRREVLARLTAALIALGALGAMVPPVVNGLARGDGLLEVVWGLLRFFTIITYLLVGGIWASVALKGRSAVSPLLLGGATLAIVLVGLVFNLLLDPVPQPNWWSALGDDLHHVWVPLAVPAWWLTFAPHCALRWSAPLIWTLYPLTYCGYAIVRAAVENKPVPYFFMDGATIGWSAAFANLAMIAAAFVVAGMIAIVADRRLPT